jgi:hypothetical protein
MTEAELVAQAIQNSMQEEESRQRRRLRDEQVAEYEESLLIDRQREEEREKQLREEEERRQREEMIIVQEKEQERLKQASLAQLVEQARQRLLASPEPSPEASPVTIQVHLPDGRRPRRAYLETEPFGRVYDFVDVEGAEALVVQPYRLVTARPRVVYENRDASLAEMGLKGRCALLVEVMDEDGDDAAAVAPA